MAVILVGTAVAWRSTFSAGSIGVSLVLIVGFGEVLARLISSWTALESSIGAVTRVKRFISETATEGNGSKQMLSSPAWPSSGGIAFHNVTASYR